MSAFPPRGRLALLAGGLAVLIIGIPAFLFQAPPPAPVGAADVTVVEEDPGPSDPPVVPPEDPPAAADDPFVLPPAVAPEQGTNRWRGPRPPAPPSPTPTDPAPTPTDPPVNPNPPVPQGPSTIVSLTFDDGSATQAAAAGILDAHGMDGTFYVNSGTIGIVGSLTLAGLHALADSGHEIGGHSVTHPDLVTLPTDEVTRQICDDRAQLLEWGFAVRSFAYPFASASDAVEAAVAACGYNSGRMLGDIRSPFSCGGCAVAESIPPADPFYTKAPDQFESTWDLATLQGMVTRADATGGWLQLTFHDICTSSCGELAISQTLLDDFLDWLTQRMTQRNIVVRPVGDVIGGAVKPVITGPAVPPPAPAGQNGIVNPGLEQVAGGVPSCWFQAPWGSNSPSFALTSPGHTGSIASRIEMSGYESGDAKILPTFDLGACAPSVTPGESYSLRAFYTATVVTQFAVYLRTVGGGWVYWTSSPWFAAASSFTEAEWTTGPIPAGYNGISFGLNIFADGVLVTDDYAIYNSVGAPPVTPPPVPVDPAPFLVAPPADDAVAPSVDVPTESVPDETPPGETPPSETSPADPPEGDPPVDPGVTPPVDPPAVEPESPPSGEPPAEPVPPES